MATGRPGQQTEPIKALAFNTLLSSQETDTHRAEPRSRRPRLRGNPSNLPGPLPLSTRSAKIVLTVGGIPVLLRRRHILRPKTWRRSFRRRRPAGRPPRGVLHPVLGFRTIVHEPERRSNRFSGVRSPPGRPPSSASCIPSGASRRSTAAGAVVIPRGFPGFRSAFQRPVFLGAGETLWSALTTVKSRRASHRLPLSPRHTINPSDLAFQALRAAGHSGVACADGSSAGIRRARNGPWLPARHSAEVRRNTS
ncbi:Uncharacterised protein [Mycobacterium tuberculosis]|nr:Uncharacterised protein [Mycobacterium tuberculosis]